MSVNSIRPSIFTAAGFKQNSNQPKINKSASFVQNNKANHLPSYAYKAFYLNNPAPVSFEGVFSEQKSSLKFFEAQLSTAAANCSEDDIVLAGKDIKTAQNDLLNSIDSISRPIEKIAFVQNDDLSGTFAILKDGYNFPYFQNLSSKPFVQKTGGKTYSIGRGDKMYIRDDSVFYEPKKEPFRILIPDFNESEKNDVANECDIEFFDLSDGKKEAVAAINRERVEAILNTGDEDSTESTNAPDKPQSDKSKEIKTEQAHSKEDDNKQENKITFKDVGGQDSAISELKRSVIFPIRYPEAFNVVNHGIILEGGPGTGKTLVALALANEADAHYIKITGGDLESKWAGQTEENWRRVFKDAVDNQPSIIFIDEFDSAARQRDDSANSRYDNKTVNQILSLMSDIEKNKDQVFVIAATNKKDLLDSAILRSGRFGKSILMNNPDVEGCRKILDIHTADKKVNADFDRDEFAKRLKEADVSGADIAAIAETAKNNAFLRADIFDKMESGTFDMEDVESLTIDDEDFYAALDSHIKETKGKDKKNPIGFIWNNA